jgi:hypothetical protein
MSVRRKSILPALALVALASALLLALPAPARASHPLETAIDPDGPFLGPNATLVSQRVHDAGARKIRLLLNWKEVAPASPPPGFDPSNPADPSYDWSEFEAELLPAAAAGLEAIVVVRTAPPWAAGAGAGKPGTVSPDAAQFARFAHAVAVRYSGGFAGLPRVRYWQVWNEPNHFSFLNPQYEGQTLRSPAIYANLLNAFADAVHAVKADNVVIAGALAPFQNPSPPVSPPLTFISDLLCVSQGSRPKATCNTRLHFDVWSHHPYTSGSPTHHASLAGDASIPELPQIRRMLRAAVRAGHVQSSQSVRFWVTEFGWDTNPPDPGAVPLGLHARWTAEALYRIWRAGVSLVTWYKIRDDATNGRPNSSTFQSGLYFRCDDTLPCDKPKPSLRAFRFPFVAFRSGRRVYVWGRTPGGKRAKVIVQQRVGKRWKRLRVLRANRYGIFSRRIRTSRRGRLRAVLRGGSDWSVAISLKRPPDRPVNPFG